MAKAAEAEDVAAAFEKHRQETEVQVERLEKVLELGKAGGGKTCPAMMASWKKVRKSSKNSRGAAAIDAGLIAAAQAVEHYEIARYGTLITWALQPA